MPAPNGKGQSACARALRTGVAVEAFCLSRVSLCRSKGAWVSRTNPVWPGYVLVEPASNVSDEDLAELGAIGELTSFESDLVRRLGGPDHLIALSEGIIQENKLRVLFGPLQGLEQLVIKIDRHRRLAWLGLEEGRRLAVGLEVTSKQ